MCILLSAVTLTLRGLLAGLGDVTVQYLLYRLNSQYRACQWRSVIAVTTFG